MMPFDPEDLKLSVTAAVLVTAVKLLLMPAYSSTDMEVHRNWMAITHHVPWNQWCAAPSCYMSCKSPPLIAMFRVET
jgi:alpha-1,3-glucosyltransferase